MQRSFSHGQSKTVCPHKVSQGAFGEAQLTGFDASYSGTKRLTEIMIQLLIDEKHVNFSAAVAIEQYGQFGPANRTEDLHRLAFLEGVPF